MKKIGLLALVVVFALGALGVGYAHWSQTLYINTEVQTGEVCVGFTYAYSYDPPADDGTCGIIHPISPPDDGTLDSSTPRPYTPCDKNVACCNVTLVGDPKGEHDGDPIYETVRITLMNGYPGYYNLVNLWVANGGTVPVVPTSMVATPYTSVLPGPSVNLTPGAWVPLDLTGDNLTDVNVRISSVRPQLDPCEVDTIAFDIHVKQDAPQGCSTMKFYADITYTQWDMATPP